MRHYGRYRLTVMSSSLWSFSTVAAIWPLCDEFQQMVVVTIEDALEEIVGEIVDESDEEEDLSRLVDPVRSGGGSRHDGRLNNHWMESARTRCYETIAGYVYHFQTF